MKSLWIVDFSVRKRVTILMMTLIIIVFGLLSLWNLGLDLLPDITYPTVSVITQYPGAAPEEIEQMITRPLEGVIAGINGVKKLSSQSSEGVSVISVEFEWGINLDYGAQDIKDNIDMIKDYLPKEMKKPIVFKFNLAQIPVLFTGITGMDDTYKLKKFLRDNVVERIQRLDGVALAAVIGGKNREIRIAVDPVRLTYHNLSINDVLQMLPAQNLNMPAGYYEANQTDFLLRSVGEFKTIEDIENAIVGVARNGVPVRLRDVAAVEDAYREVRNVSKMNGMESVFMVVNKRSGSNTLQVSRLVREEIRKIERLYPHIRFVTIFDQGEPIEKVARKTTENAVVGGFLAILFMWLFLVSIRPTLVVAIAIPFSIIATFIAVYMAGYTLNMMTLGGLALGVGKLVDDAIVVIENIFRHMEKGESRQDATRFGTSEVAMAITSSTITSIIVFFPLVFSQGLAGRLTRGLALTIMFSLLASLLVAMTVVPMLASVYFKERSKNAGSNWFYPVRDWYGRQLAAVLNHPAKFLLIVVIISGISLSVGVKKIGKEFMPAGDHGMFYMNIELPMGTPLEESERISGQVRELIKEYAEVNAVGEVIGRSETDRSAEPAAVTGPNNIQLYVRLFEVSERKRTTQEFEDLLRKRFPKLKNTRISFTSMNTMASNKKPVEVNVYGKNLITLREITDSIAAVMKTVPGLKDIESSFSKGRPEYHFAVDRQKALTYGLAPIQIQAALEAANLGKVVTIFRTQDEEIDMRVMLDDRYRKTMDWIKNIPVKTAMGQIVPLSQFVTVSQKEGPTTIYRDSKYRVGTVDANLSGMALGSAVGGVKMKIKRLEQALPEGYTIQFKGQYENMQETFIQLFLGFLIAVLLVYMVMASSFESLMHPFVIMFTLPLSIIGVILALLFSGRPFSVVAFVSSIILVGVVVNNGIVLIDFVNRLRAGGMGIREALIEGSKTRIRPILITAGTTIFGAVPLAFSRGEGSEINNPLALVLIGGLASSTFLTLFVLPVIYMYFDRAGSFIKRSTKKFLG